MNKKRRGLQAVILLILSALLISACEQSLSSAPVATPTEIEGLFVSPFPAADNPMAMIEEFARQTSVAQTATAGGDPFADIETAIATMENGALETPTPDLFSTPTNAEPAAAADTAVPAATSVPLGVRPATYTLQKGEFPYCIARRFNTDPNELLRLSGLTSAQANSLMVGTVLTIPQSGAFPGNRALQAHPATHTVSSGETLYGIACKYGDVDPNAIATANNITLSTPLTVGQQLQIP